MKNKKLYLVPLLGGIVSIFCLPLLAGAAPVTPPPTGITDALFNSIRSGKIIVSVLSGGAAELGYANVASGLYAIAMGVGSEGLGQAAIALGASASASGGYSFAVGYNPTASGSDAIAMGDNANASNSDAVAIGPVASATGSMSMAFGYFSNAQNTQSTAIGAWANALAIGATALGPGASAGGNYALALGHLASAAGLDSVAIGNSASASGNNSAAMGQLAVVTAGEAMALGKSSNAGGIRALAVGSNVSASATESMALGVSSTASGQNSNAIGTNAVATGNYATALGDDVTAQAYRSVVMGSNNVISGNSTGWTSTDPIFVVGNGSGSPSNAMTILKNGKVGIGATAPSALLTVENSSGGAAEIGASTNSATGTNAIAMGAGSVASNTYATAMGTSTASGYISTALGAYNTASGSYSTAMGYGTIASGGYSTATGYSNIASGDSSAVFGSTNTASGGSSIAGGYGSVASAVKGVSIGDSTRADSYNSFVIGRYNVSGGTPGSWVSTEPLFVIGNGTSNAARADAFKVNKDGRVIITTTTDASGAAGTGGLEIGGALRMDGNEIITNNSSTLYLQNGNTGDLSVDGGTFFVDSSSNYVGIGTTSPSAGLHIKRDGWPSSFLFLDTNAASQDSGIRLYENGIVKGHIYNNSAVDTLRVMSAAGGTTGISILSGGSVGINTEAPTATLSVNGTANKPGGGTWTAFSDRRLKDVHGNYDLGLDEILKLNPVKFNYKNGNSLNLPSDQEYIGFIAQEVQKVFPAAVTQNVSGYLEFDMHPVNVAVINAIKELKAENDELRAVVCELKPGDKICTK